jgi:hypothetical protein
MVSQPPGTLGVSASAWRRELEHRGDLDGTDKRARKRFHELKRALKNKNVIVEQERVVWVPAL